MTVYQFLPLLALFINAALAVLVIFGHARQRSHVVFALFLASMALWGGTIFLMRSSAILADAFFWENLVLVNFYLISVSFLHFTYIFSGVRPRPWLLPAAYSMTGLVIVMSFSGLVAEGMQLKFYGYAPIGGPLLFPYLALSYGCIGLALKNILSVYRQPLSQAQRNRAGYLIIGAAFSMLGTITDLLPLTGLPVYPLGIVGNILFPVVASVAILRYRLLDINIVLRRVVGYLLVFISLAGVSVLGSIILQKTIDPTFLSLALVVIALMIASHALLSILLSKVQPGVLPGTLGLAAGTATVHHRNQKHLRRWLPGPVPDPTGRTGHGLPVGGPGAARRQSRRPLDDGQRGQRRRNYPALRQQVRLAATGGQR
jgi:hypothetical protein